MIYKSVFAFVILALTAGMAWAGDTIHHTIEATIAPADHRIIATDTITIPASLAKDGLIFQINRDLAVKKISGSAGFEEVAENRNVQDVGMDRDNDNKETIVKANLYRLTGVPSGKDVTLTLRLSGRIDNPVKQLSEEYARGFSQSPGLIEERGVYLAGATYWVPTVKDVLVTYDLTVKMPNDWRSVSQGERTLHRTDDVHTDRWVVDTPTEEIYLIAAKFTEYEIPAGNVKVMAFLRTPDEALANRYLEATAQYMEMYRDMLGPYPYSKFALVENFWETGYGMPSFTLLGSQIIRFPFILHSSYPHELLHNWWGNSVYIDFKSGNWAEGLTAYMADHLIAEQRGKGANYRRSTLQRYTNYVDDKTDFPIRKFVNRYNAVTEAVGYGKTSMVWNMLRDLVGDENFKRSFQLFYRTHKFKVGTFDDIRKSFEDVTGKNLKPFFKQWIDGTGAPELTIVGAKQSGDSLKLTLKQVQKHGVFDLQVPLVIYTADRAERHMVPMDKRSQTYSINVKGKIARVEVDPEFNLFRRLHWAEIPPSLGNAFGAKKVVMILPSEASDALKKRYKKLAAIWRSGKITVISDNDIKKLPKDGAVWILGRSNRFYSVIEKALSDYDAAITKDGVRFGKHDLDMADNSTVIAVRNPANPKSVLVGLTVHSDAAVPGLARKLPHYGKYSYLAFTHDAPDNSAKGQWPAVGSPLVAVLDKSITTTAKLTPRPALAQLKPVFDAKRMMADVTYLASPALEGRGVGTKGLEKAASYIIKSLKSSGIKPAGENGGWVQTFTVNGPKGTPVTVENIVGVIPGKNPKLAGQSVVLSAHYDHLGYGWPNVRAAFAGQMHPGADDNASGIAVLLELARTLAKSAPDRSIILLASTAEESGLLGARHYVKVMKKYPVAKAIADVNLDTVGRAGKKIMVFDSNTATEWRFIFMGTEATTGIQTALVQQAVNASDHTAFTEAGVPAIHIFGSPTADYHRPSDTADKVRPESLVRVAALTKEVIEYLAQRPKPLTSTLKVADPNAARILPPATRRSGRKVSTGTMPDFTFNGKGVRVSQVAPKSAGAEAGLKAGDIITSFGGKPVTNLRDYTNILGKYTPGDKVDVIVKRGKKDVSLKLTLKKR